MFGWNFFAKYKHTVAVLLAAVTGLSVVFLCRVRPDENIHAMIPAKLLRQVELFEHSPLNKKIFVGVTADSAEEAFSAAESLRNRLAEAGLLRLPPAPDMNFAVTLFHALPARFLPSDELLLQKKLMPQAVAEKMQQNYNNLLSFEGFLVKPLILADPLGLTELMAQKLAAFGAGTALEYKDGFLSSADGKTYIGPYDLAGDAADFKDAKHFAKFFEKLSAELPPTVHAFYLGALRYTVENVSVIQADLIKISGLALILLAAVFWFFFRHKSALLIYLLPVLILPPAAWVTYMCFGHLSGITLGFGSVVAGLSVDYSVYLFFALRRGGADAVHTLQHLRKHLLCNFMTSALCFLALFCSSVELFRQLAVFSVTGLAISLLLALYVFPHYWENLPPLAIPAPRKFFFKPLSKRAAVWVSVLVVLFGMVGLWRTHFSGNIEELNASSPAFEADKAVFDRVFEKTSQNRALLFVLGNTPEAALEANEALCAKLPEPLAVSAVFPSQKARAENAARWQDFWTANRIQYTRLLTEESAAKVGLKASLFEPFFDGLSSPEKDEFDFTPFYNPIAPLEDGRFAVVNLVPNTPEVAQTAAQEGAVFVAADGLKKGLIGAVKQEALQIVCLAVLFNLAAVLLVFRSVKTALLAFVPVCLAACFTFGCFWVFSVTVNLFVLVFLPLLMGLGIDYGIFQIMKERSAGGAFQNAYPPAALAAAALSTLAGFGVLALAKHGVLFIMGLSSFLGVGGALLAAYFILPVFLERQK